MRRKFVFGLVFLCFIQLYVAKDITNIQWINSDDFLETDVKSNDTVTGCDCGMNSTECKFDEKGKKICTCELGFKGGNYGICTPMCSDKNRCANGGLCFQDICVCLAGTGGPFCETIYECENELCGKERAKVYGDETDSKYDTNMSLCKYDTKLQKAYCDCGQSSFFDYVDKMCKVCECGNGRCEVRQGQKLCHCNKQYSYNPVSALCEICDCTSGNCSFDSDGKKICKCSEGFLSYKGTCRECKCGPHGTCRYITPISKFMKASEKPIKVCTCDAGYNEYKGTCLKCDCSPNGKCSFSSSGSILKCVCDPGFQEISGKCQLCDCGPDANRCSFKKNSSPARKVCNCRRGFKEDKGYCRDIDECLDTEICSGDGTECENTIGSFKCRCRPGYITRIANKTSLCQKEEELQPDYKPWKIGYGILSAGFIVIIIGLVVVIFKIRKS